MPTSEPLHVAFVWHMHQPYYRSALTGAFDMPWARMHALKDYLDMVEVLGSYPDLHQTFNLVPSLVEQLEHYASGDFVDVYWQHALKPAAELDPAERAFVVERLCERSDHPRARSHPRYLELARKREAQPPGDWEACARAFTIDELRDLQIWFNLAWFDPQTRETSPLRELVDRGRDYREDDKLALTEVQAGILARTLPAYKAAAVKGQIELSTSPYFHPILPLLANTDSARISAPDTLLPPRRFAHPEDAAQQVKSALAKHDRVFGEPPRGMWCSEQAVGEDVIPLLIDAGLAWTISDESVLARSLSGAAAARSGAAADIAGQAQAPTSAAPLALSPGALHTPYRLERETGEIAMVFRDHTLSDLIGFVYQSWDSHEAAADMLRRLHEIRSASRSRAGGADVPLVTIALDGENAWEYYPRDGRDFLRYLYEGLSADPALRSVTISEHLREAPAGRPLGWLHTGSWIGGDLRTWSGDPGHNAAWDHLHRARDRTAAHRRARPGAQVEAAWRHILIAEGSDWFWWFGEHHHTQLDHVWDLGFRLHLQAVYRLLGEPIPFELFLPLLEQGPSGRPALPRGPLAPVVNGVVDGPEEWQAAGYLAPDLPPTMQPSTGNTVAEVRFGWRGASLCLLVAPNSASSLAGLEVEIRLGGPDAQVGFSAQLVLVEGGLIEVSCSHGAPLAATVEAAWKDVLEISLPLTVSAARNADGSGLIVRAGRGEITQRVFHSAGLASLGWGEQ